MKKILAAALAALLLLSMSGIALAAEEQVTIEPAVIYDEQGITVRVEGLNEDNAEFSVGLVFENDTDANYNFYIYSNALAINGLMTDDVWSVQPVVPAGKKARSMLTISKDWLAANEMYDVEYIDMILSGYTDDAGASDVKTGVIRVTTSAYTEDKDWSTFSEEPAYKDDVIIVHGFQGDKLTTPCPVYVMNTSDEYISVTMDNASVNEWGYDTDIQVFDDYILPGCMRNCQVKVKEDFMELNEIDEITSLGFTLKVEPVDDYKRIYTTSAICLEMK